MRCSRGFGIHSPFAFDLVQNTLRERSPYYIYDVIDTMQPCHRDSLKLIVRLVCRLRPSSCCVVGDIAPEVGQVIKGTDSGVTFTDASHAAMIIAGHHAQLSPADAIACLERGGTIVLLEASCPSLSADFFTDRAMTFSNGRVIIAVGRHDLPHQRFELNF